MFGCSNENSNDDSKNTNTVKLVKIVEFDNNDNETTTTVLNYDGNKIASTTTTDFEGIFKTKYIYENGKIVKQERYTNDIRKTNEDRYFEYEGDNISIAYGYDGSTTLFTSKYSYNSKGQMILEKQYDDDKYCCETTYSYDSNGNFAGGNYDNKKNPAYYAFPMELIKISEISKNNLLSDGDSTYEYIYNEKGYPTKKIETHDYKEKTIVTNYYYE